ncbi:MAG TPA: NAD(P)H-dependent oxidoreductase subunit E [Candidatus Dormibacteraeota bacterium]|nr:NAD(P)H-dependent oxidoreductase subunit E [Candidatus Dormibacteraeota bacterium]
MTQTAPPRLEVPPIDPRTRAAMERARDRYPRPMSAILPALWAVQDQYGWLPPSGMAAVADVLGLTASEVQAVATFYSMYFQRPAGRHHVLVCINAPCALRGADDLCAYLERRLGVASGGTTGDGEFTWESTIECLGACGYAPMMQIDHHFHEFLTTSERVDTALDSVRGTPAHTLPLTLGHEAAQAVAGTAGTPAATAAPVSAAPLPVEAAAATPGSPAVEDAAPEPADEAAPGAPSGSEAAPRDAAEAGERHVADRRRRRGRRAK